jgi:hypothetical protein
MKKLKLDLDQVRVVSFTIETTQGSRGTVNGFAPDTVVGCGGTGGHTDGGDSCRICQIVETAPDVIC